MSNRDMKTILVLGGYGNFGWRISRALAQAGLSFVIAGRNGEKARSLADELQSDYPEACISTEVFDVNHDLLPVLLRLSPLAVVNTCGPFQLSDYSVAEACISVGTHYIDLADGRDFVTGMSVLDERARKANVLVVSGASTVPGLSSAVLEEYGREFSCLDELVFGIAPGQKSPRGLATTKAILTYIGKPLKPFAGMQRPAYGWQDIYRQSYPEIGARWMANCDIPDIDLLPPRYGIGSIRFSAGMENALLHWGIWCISWLVRFGLPLDLPRYHRFLWRLSTCFDWLGTDEGGMHMIMRGKGLDGKTHERCWYIIGKRNEGPNIPTVPAIVLAKKLVADSLSLRGFHPCVGLLSLEEYMYELKDFAIKTVVE